jgi:polar amino acid transport system permease protein
VATSERNEQGTGRPEEIKAVPVRRPGRWIAAAIVLLIAASLIRSVINNTGPNKGFQWHVVGQYLFDSRILHGVVLTLELTVISMAIGVVLGIVLAVMRQSPNPVVSGASWLYIWFFRGTPLYVQLLFWSFFGALYKTIDLGVPFGPSFIHLNSNSTITVFVAGVLGFSLNEGAYMAEIVRAGIIAVDEGQSEAAQSLGLNRLQIMRRIVLPQAMRVILPPTGNETISMLKNTSLAVAVGGSLYELLSETEHIYYTNYAEIPLLIVACLWYLALTSVAYVGQYFLERRFGRGFTRVGAASMRERWLTFGSGRR